MKWIYTVVLLSVSMISNAQSWVTPGSVWRYNFINLSGQGYIQIEAAGDTVIEGINCNKLVKRIFQRNAFTGTTQNFVIGNEYTYDTNGVAMLYFDNAFDTLYNFNAIAGETWNVAGVSPIQSVCNETSVIEVIAAENVTINGVVLKQLIVDYKYRTTGTFIIRDTIIERIGTLRQYMIPWDLCLSTVDGNEGGELRCFNDNEIGEYKHNFFSNCNVLVNNEDWFAQNIKVYPVPFSEVLVFKNDNGIDISAVAIKDLAGNIVYTEKYLPEYINTQNFTQGIYFLEVIDNYGNRSIKKLIK